MKIIIKKANVVSVLALYGKLDTLSSPDTQKKIEAYLEKEEPKNILFNLEKTPYISSAGLRVILATVKKMKTAGGMVKICNPNDVVKEILDISGFSGIIEVFTSETDAINSFQ